MAEPLPNRKALIVKAVIKSLTKSLALSALVMAPGMALLVMGLSTPGMMALFLASFWLMSRSYKRPWRLTTFACFSPPLVALASYLLQLWLFAGAGLSAVAVAVAVGLGVFIGWWRGRSHQLYWEDGSLFAKRTFGYLLSWVLAYGFTQALAMTATSVLLIRAGLLTGAFTTTLLVMVSVMLLRQRRTNPAVSVANVAGLLFASIVMTATVLVTSVAWTQSVNMYDTDNPVVQELQAALDSGNAADLFGAALATGLNDDLGLLELERMIEDPSEPETEEFLGFQVSAAQFRATSVEDDLEIAFFVGSGQNARNRLLVDMFGPTLLDKLHAWILSPDRRDDDGEEFHGTIERVDVGDYGLIIYGSGDGDATAIGVFLSGGRAVMAAFESKGQEHRVQEMVDMTMATMWYMEQMYTAGPGTFTAVAEKATAVLAATLVMLTSAGIAVSLAQAIAAAVGQAVQATTDTTTQAVVDALDGESGPGRGGVDTATKDESSESRPPPVPPPPTPKGPTLYDKEGEAFARNDEGKYWSPDGKGKWRWQDEPEARNSSAALRRERGDRQAEQARHDRETDRMLGESRRKIQSQNEAEEEAFRQRQLAEEQAERLTAERRRRVAELMRERANRHGGVLKEEVDTLVGQGNEAGLEDLLRDRLQKEMAEGKADAATEEAWGKVMGVGEGVARATVAGSKAALMAVGGPAGMGVTGMAVGAVSAGEAGGESAMRGDSLGEFTKKTVAGFASGFKDGATSIYTKLPGTGKAAKLLVPASADALETLVRTGDGWQAMVSGASSLAGDSLGGGVDGFKSPLGRELGSAAVTVTVAEGANYANGGKFGDAYQGALINHLGGKVGGKLGNASTGYTTDPELRVNAALKAGSSGPREIPVEDQSAIVQKLNGSRHTEVLVDAQGKPHFDRNGDPVTGEFVNSRGALSQLQDTRSSRTAKQAPAGLREAIIATRQKKIYDPADRATIEKVTPTLQKQGLLRRGDTVEMDSFSTPGSKPSLGADRDARLVVKRPTEPNLKDLRERLESEQKGLLKRGDTLEVDTSGRQQDGLPPGADANDRVFVRGADGQRTELPRKDWESFDRIEVDRKIWERTALKDFHDHTTALARAGGGQITRESQPEFFRRRDELGFMRRPDTPEAIAKQQGYSQEQIAKLQKHGLTQDEIDHQAWAAAHNQLFTDRNHMEASRDNADQIFKAVNGRLEQEQKISNVLGVQDGKVRLNDAEGFGRMWAEKSSFYRHNQPEAVAQSQKGVASLMKIRAGYRAQDYEPPPFNDQTAKAMEVVLKAPVGVEATPEAMARVESDLQGLGYRDMHDALTKIAQQHELLKWSKKDSATAVVEDLNTSDAIRAALGSGSHRWEDLEDKE